MSSGKFSSLSITLDANTFASSECIVSKIKSDFTIVTPFYLMLIEI